MKLVIFLSLSFLFIGSAHAKLVQILHTNDLHSFFDGTRYQRGGYARLKTVMDKLRADADSKGIRSLTLDAGDFGEGTSYFLSNEGSDSLKALDLLGVDASVVGNHDFILGGPELAEQILKANISTTILSANLVNKDKMKLDGLVQDYKDFDLDGLKIRVFGLTTSQIHFQYPLKPLGSLASAVKTGIKQAEMGKKAGAKFVIALTHLGVKEDAELVSKSKDISLVVGGHSHTRLEKVKYQKNPVGKLIPIVQTGAHGMSVGALLLDIKESGEYSVVDYKLHDITPEIAEDKSVKKFVESAHKNREAYFGRSWNEVIGKSEIILSGYRNGKITEGKTCWSSHLAEMTKQAVNADLGLQIDNFQGEQIPAGNITFGDIIDNFPHFRKYGDHGWSISTSKINGLIVKKIMGILSSLPKPVFVTMAGLSGKSTKESFDFNSQKNGEPLINGKPIENFKSYTMAFPGEIAFAIEKESEILRKLLLPGLQESNVYFWSVIESYIKDRSPITCDI